MLWLPLGAGGAAARNDGMLPHPFPGPGTQQLSIQHNAQVTEAFPGVSEEVSGVGMQGALGPDACPAWWGSGHGVKGGQTEPGT